MTYKQDDTTQNTAKDEATRDMGYTKGEDTQQKGGTSTAETPEPANETDHGAMED